MPVDVANRPAPLRTAAQPPKPQRIHRDRSTRARSSPLPEPDQPEDGTIPSAPPPPSQTAAKAPADPRPNEPAPKKKAPRGALADPKIANADLETSVYSATPGKAVVDGISAHDPDQGYLGDCWFVASLSAVAQSQPKLLKNSIRSNDDGSTSVRLYPGGRPKWVRIDSDLPKEEDGGLSYASSTNKAELWPSLFEKAAAQLKGGYGKLDGGYATDGMTLLTGKRSDRKKNSRLSDDQLWTRLTHAERNNKPITASTKNGENKHVKHGLVDGHAYTLLGTEREGDDRYVQLRNPWGHGEYEPATGSSDIDLDKDGKLDGDDGVFRMKLADFRDHFKCTDMNDPPQDRMLFSARLILTGVRAMGPLNPNFFAR